MKAANEPVDLDTYLRLFQPYENQMRDFQGRQGEYGARFALLFRQVMRLLVLHAEINQQLPGRYPDTARRYLANQADIVHHYTYEDNRFAFLSSLLEWLKVYERGRKMRDLNQS
jgi:hypothetical protein